MTTMQDKQLYYMGKTLRRVIYQHSHTLNNVRLGICMLGLVLDPFGWLMVVC